MSVSFCLPYWCEFCYVMRYGHEIGFRCSMLELRLLPCIWQTAFSSSILVRGWIACLRQRECICNSKQNLLAKMNSAQSVKKHPLRHYSVTEDTCGSVQASVQPRWSSPPQFTQETVIKWREQELQPCKCLSRMHCFISSQEHQRAELACRHPTAYATHDVFVSCGLTQISTLCSRWIIRHVSFVLT